MFNTSLNNPTKGRLIESYQNGTSWYRLYSDGWCEQGGSQDLPAFATTTLTLLIPLNVLYASGIRSTANHTSPESNPMIGVINGGTQIQINTGSGATEYFFWKVEGYKL